MDNLEFLKHLNMQIIEQINTLEKDRYERKQILYMLNDVTPKKRQGERRAIASAA